MDDVVGIIEFLELDAIRFFTKHLQQQGRWVCDSIVKFVGRLSRVSSCSRRVMPIPVPLPF
jgi:hypothetical protein